MLTVKAVN